MTPEPAQLLRYLPEFKVIVCTSCQYALQPQAISRHLKDIHHILRSLRRPYLQYVSKFHLDEPETVMQSSESLKHFPVPFLPVLQGLRCGQHDCSHLCVAEKRMKHHWSLEHADIDRLEMTWEHVPLQTFFRGNSLRYFTEPRRLDHLHDLRLNAQGVVIKDASALLMHYITSTSATLAVGTDTPAHSKSLQAQTVIWQEVIPQLAQDSVFLMYGILACSALQEQAMPLFREALGIMNRENCHATLAFIHLLAIHSFAFEQEDERLLVVDPDSPNVVTDWLSVLRSGCHYVSLVREYVVDGPLKALLCEWEKPVDVFEDVRMPLVDQLLSIIPAKGSGDAWSEQDCQTYRNAVFSLGYAFLSADEFGKDFSIWDALRVWLVILSSTYFELLRALHPGALIVLAHYCHLLHKLDGKWYLEGRANRLLMQIMQRLDTNWHPYIDMRSE
jgi:hypothetical protein